MTAPVTLREITRDTVRRICALEVAPEQRHFVAPNAVSIAEAHGAGMGSEETGEVDDGERVLRLPLV